MGWEANYEAGQRTPGAMALIEPSSRKVKALGTE